jgi:hypothetical protein
MILTIRTFNGKLPVRLPLIKEERNLEISGSVVTTSIEILRRFAHIISKGLYERKISCY